MTNCPLCMPLETIILDATTPGILPEAQQTGMPINHKLLWKKTFVEKMMLWTRSRSLMVLLAAVCMWAHHNEQIISVTPQPGVVFSEDLVFTSTILHWIPRHIWALCGQVPLPFVGEQVGSLLKIWRRNTSSGLDRMGVRQRSVFWCLRGGKCLLFPHAGRSQKGPATFHNYIKVLSFIY